MALSDELSDQQIKTPAVSNGVMVSYSSTQMTAFKAVSPASSVYAFTHNFLLPTGGNMLTFRKGVAYALAPAVKTALLALSAPMVAQ